MAVPACHAASMQPLLGEGGAAAIASSAQSRLPLAEAGSVAGMAAAAARGRVLCLFDVDGTLTPARQVARHGGFERWGGGDRGQHGGARPAGRGLTRRFPSRKSSRRWTRSCESCVRGCTSAWWEALTTPR